MVCTEATLRADRGEIEDECDVDVTVRFPANRETQSMAVLVTKESHCLEAILEAHENDELDTEVEVVIGNHDDLEPLARAHTIPSKDIGDENGTPDEAELLDLLAEYDVDRIVLARYVRILNPEVVFQYESRIINVHPSQLPAFPGASAYRQAIEEGVRIAGVTAHYATTDLDQGPITQRVFTVPDDATEDELRRSANRSRPRHSWRRSGSTLRTISPSTAAGVVARPRFRRGSPRGTPGTRRPEPQRADVRLPIDRCDRRTGYRSAER